MVGMKMKSVCLVTKTSTLFFAFIIASMFLITPAFASDVVLNVGMNSQNYGVGDNMTITGSAYGGTTVLNDTVVNISILNSTQDIILVANATTDDSGQFSSNVGINASYFDSGDYNVSVTILNTENIIPMSVTGVSTIYTELVSDSIVLTSFNTSAYYSITEDPSMGDVKAGNFSYLSKTDTIQVIINQTMVIGTPVEITGLNLEVIAIGEDTAAFRIGTSTKFITEDATKEIGMSGIIVTLNNITYSDNVSDRNVNVTVASKTGLINYSIIIENTSSKYDTIYIDDDNNMTFSNATDTTKPYRSLKEGSSLNIADKKFTVWYIDPKGNFTILIEKITPIFGVADNDSKMIVLALDSEKSPVVTDITVDFVDSEGTINISDKVLGSTDSNGILETTFNLSSDAGTHNIIFNDGLGFNSYNVERFKMKVAVTNEYGDPIYMMSPGDTIFLKTSLLDISTGMVIIDDTVEAEAKVSGPSILEKLTLSDNNNGIYTNNYTIPASKDGEFSVQFKTRYNNYQQVMKIKFKVKDYELFMMPVSMEKGPSEGFAPGENGTLFITGITLTTGNFVNISGDTNNCDSTDVRLKGIYNKAGVDKSEGNYTNYNLSEYFSYIAEELNGSIDPFIQKEIKTYFGENVCVILFTAPETEGVYTIETELNISGKIENINAPINVQDVFIYSYSASDDGRYQDAISPGSNINLVMDIYDSLTGEKISNNKIISAELIEVIAESSDEIVTNNMLDVHFNNSFTKYGNLAALSFTANDSIMGHHFVSFKVFVNVTRSGSEKTVEAIGTGWFQAKMYRVWAYPVREKGNYFDNDDTISMNVKVTDASGSNGKEGISVTLDEVIYRPTWESIKNIDANTCQTDDSGECILTISAPSSGWSSGGYLVRAKITDDNDVNDYGQGWFEVKQFNFDAWIQNWEVPTNKSIMFNVSVKDSDGVPIYAEISIDKIYYEGTEDHWQQPTIVKDKTEMDISELINGSGTITIPAGTITKDGYYSVVFSAEYNGVVEISRAWFKTKTFMIFASPEIKDNWDHSFGTSETVTIVIDAFDEVFWSNSYYGNYNGAGHNITNAWVYTVRKDGMWDSAYKNEDELRVENEMVSSCNLNSCNLTFNLTGFDQGNYDLVIMTNDTAGKVAKTWFWMRVEKFKISVPQVVDWYRVSLDNGLQSGKVITLTQSCGGEYDDSLEPENVTNCKSSRLRMARYSVNSNLSTYSEYYTSTYYLLDKNASRLYVNATGFNFSSSPFYSINESFVDAEGAEWNITGMDVTENKVTLDCVNCIYGEAKETDPDTGNTYVDDTVLYIINKSLSKSGTFLTLGDAGNFYDYMRDEQWADIDLDNDSIYNDDKYAVLLADTTEAGVYDTVLLSQTRNFTDAVDSNVGLTGDGDLRFNENAKPIYLLDMKFTKGDSSSSGASSDYYKLQFTSNRPEHSGRHLGVFEAGTIVQIPIMVTTPSTGEPIINATVNVTKLSFNKMYDVLAYPANAVAMNTTEHGMAIVELDTTGLASGSYFINIEVKDPSDGEIVTIANQWDNPQLDIRNFEVRGELGFLGIIDNIQELSESAETIESLDVDELLSGQTSQMYMWDDLYHVGDWRLHSIYYNFSSDEVYVNNNSGDWYFNVDNYTAYDISDPIDIIAGNGAINRLSVNVTVENIVELNISEGFDEGPISKVYKNYNFTVYGSNGSIVSMSISDTSDEWQQNMIDWSETISMVSEGDLVVWDMFNITSITDQVVVINWTHPAISVKNVWSDNMDDLDSGRPIIARYSDEIEIIGYNNINITTAGDMNGWFGNFDSVKIINLTSNNIIGTYPIGVQVPELDNKAVIAIDWSGIKLSDLKVNDNIVSSLPWACDSEKYYVANFTEVSTGLTIEENYELYELYGAEYLSTKPYYLLMYDGECNNFDKVTTALIDDDTVFDTHHVKEDPSCIENYNAGVYCNYIPWDYDHPEEGSIGWDGNNRSENWLNVGQMSWPFTVTSFNESEGTAKVFKSTWDYDASRNLTMWVTAKDFTGVAIEGNVSLVEIIGHTYGCTGPEETVITNITAEADIIAGVGYLEMDLTSLNSGDYEFKFKVNSDDGKTETLKKQMWIQDKMGVSSIPYESCSVSATSAGGGVPAIEE